MATDACNWVTQCSHCQVAKGNYTTPRPKIGHLESNNPMDLLCLDFTKIDPSRTGKENVLIMTNAFSKFSVAVVTLDGFFYYFISEFCVLLALQCGDRESSLAQNGGLLVACCSTSRCVLVSC